MGIELKRERFYLGYDNVLPSRNHFLSPVKLSGLSNKIKSGGG